MIHHQLVSDESGVLINGTYAMASAAVTYTEGIDTRRGLFRSGLYLQFTGSIALERQVSFDNEEWVTPYDENLHGSGTLFTLQHGDSSGVYSLWNAQSSPVLTHWTRFKITAAKAATITTFEFFIL